MKIEAAIFDLDGTILDSMCVWQKIDEEFLTRRGIKVPPSYAEEICGLSFREVADYTIKRFALQETPEALMREWNDMAICEYAQNVVLKPNVKEYLELLKKRNIKLAIATGLSKVLYEPALLNRGIRSFFDVIVSADEVERGKEFPDIFLYTAEQLQVAPERCIVFEDILPAIRSAKLAGMYVYGVFDDSSMEQWEEIKRIADGVIYDFRNAPFNNQE